MIVDKRKDYYDVYIGRPSIFGNPFSMRSERDRMAVIEKYREYFLARIESDPVFKQKVLALKGKRLGCFCAPKPCHGDVIIEWLKEQ